MTPLTEYRELVTRFWKMIDAIVLLVFSLAHLAVSVVVLFCVAWTTVARTGRAHLDRMAERIKAPKEVEA